MTIQRDYLHVGDRHVHLRRAGTGPALVMCHPSPGSSLMLEPLMTALARTRSVLALDTPGYGLSDPLGAGDPSAAQYAEALAETLDTAGLDRTDLYGAHTGAKIALELAVREPARVRRLVLDGLGLYSEQERAELLAHYTPELDPDPHGSHLLRYWAIRRDMHLFYPWYRHTAEARIARDLPTPGDLHRHVVDFLLAGPGYGKGYRAAFRHDTAGALQRVRVPTLIVASARDPMRAHLDRFTPPPTVTVAAPGEGEDPVAGVAARIIDFLDGERRAS